MPLVELEDVASYGPVGERDVVPDSSGDYADLVRTDEDVPEFGSDVQHSVLEHDQKVSIGAVKGGVVIHGFSSGKDEYAYALLHRRIPSPCNKLERVYPVDSFIQIKRIPSQLIWYLVQLVVLRIGIVRRRFPSFERRMRSRWQDAVEPRLHILVTRGGESGSGELLGV